MKPFPPGFTTNGFPIERADDPCLPLTGEGVYFQQKTGRDVVYDVRSDRPITEVYFRGAGLDKMLIEVSDPQGNSIARIGPLGGGNRWGEFVLAIPSRTPREFRLRLHNEIGDWLYVDRLELRSGADGDVEKRR